MQATLTCAGHLCNSGISINSTSSCPYHPKTNLFQVPSLEKFVGSSMPPKRYKSKTSFKLLVPRHSGTDTLLGSTFSFFFHFSPQEFGAQLQLLVALLRRKSCEWWQLPTEQLTTMHGVLKLSRRSFQLHLEFDAWAHPWKYLGRKEEVVYRTLPKRMKGLVRRMLLKVIFIISSFCGKFGRVLLMG